MQSSELQWAHWEALRSPDLWRVVLASSSRRPGYLALLPLAPSGILHNGDGTGTSGEERGSTARSRRANNLRCMRALRLGSRSLSLGSAIQLLGLPFSNTNVRATMLLVTLLKACWPPPSLPRPGFRPLQRQHHCHPLYWLLAMTSVLQIEALAIL